MTYMLLLATCTCVLLATVRQGQCQDIVLCVDNQEQCQNLTSFSKLATYLMSTNCCEAEAVFASCNLSEVVHFENLSSTLTSIALRGESGNTLITCAYANSGFYFGRLQNISLVNVTVQNCGFMQTSHFTSGSNFHTALYFLECSDVTLESVTVLNSRGSGVTMLDNGGHIRIHHSRFEHSKMPEGSLGGNGFYLVLSGVRSSHISFKYCHFMDNYADFIGSSSKTYGIGGGLYVSIEQNSSNNDICLDHCTVMKNVANWGGGLYFQYHGRSPENNSIQVVHTEIADNNCSKGGGGVDIGYLLFYDDSKQQNYNIIHFHQCNFTNNSAVQYGGGVAIYGTRSLHTGSLNDHITFESCNWVDNSALGGSAVDIAAIFVQVLDKGVFPIVYFANCIFLSNTIRPMLTRLGPDATVSSMGSGAVAVEGFLVKFQETVLFESNYGSAFVMSSASAEILENSNVSFVNNTGRNGGAISMHGLSSIIIHDSTTLEFVGNKAIFEGGALFVSSNDLQGYLLSRRCFILYDGYYTDISKRRIQFTFKGNKAFSNIGHDVYASSTQACVCENFQKNAMVTFQCIGSISAESFDLKTNSKTFSLNDNTNSSNFSNIIPGSSYEIPITAKDEYNQVKEVAYKVINENENQHSLKSHSSYISQNIVHFMGNTNVSDTFVIETSIYALSFNISSSRTCPPGLVMSQNECVCAAESYFGVAFCNQSGTFLINGFWIGLCPNDENLSICTSHCPLGFCQYNNNNNSYVHTLPERLSDLDVFVCGEKRTGVICGSCQANHSAYYHSYRYDCGEEDLCDFGILFYIVSELVPLTIMFLVVILLDISFTSGKVNGFIFFAQVLDSVSIDANGVINFPTFLNFITASHRFIYRTLNFDFFSIECLSFCLWRGATVLDAMAMKFVTVLYAVALLIAVILSMNIWKCSKRANYCLRYRTLKNTVVHGLTAFAVICYSQCARVSFQILSPTVLYGLNYTVVDHVVFRRGIYSLFSVEHLRYALPAISVLLVMSLLPFLLILYPLIFKVLALCKLSESLIANIVSRLIPIPLLDAFQSSFKDNCRYFAGFYFLYRLFALLAYAYSTTLVTFYTIVELQLVIILALHAAVQPYKNHWHNVIDSLVFANLAIINGITLFNYIIVIDANDRNRQSVVAATLSIQAVLIYLPLMCLALYIALIIIRKVKARLTMNMPSDSSLIDSIDLPPLREIDDQPKKAINVYSVKGPFLTEYSSGTNELNDPTY